MRKRQNQALLFLLSAVTAAQLGTAVPVYGAQTTEESKVPVTSGSWQYENGSWKFYNDSHAAVTGWVHTASGWYYLRQSDGTMVTGWQNINENWYYFNTQADGITGQMKTGWWLSPNGSWYFFNNRSGDPLEGAMVRDWQWIDGKCYFFNRAAGADYGKLLVSTTTPDGYSVNADGQWIDANGNVQTNGGMGFVTTTGTAADLARTGLATGSRGSSPKGSSGGGGGSSHGGGETKPEVETKYEYMLMNIPYEEFYAAEVENNDVDVDAVSSATKNKPRTMGLVGGSYHVNSDGTDISGVIFPVMVKEGTDLSKYRQVTDTDSVSITVTNRGQTSTTTYTGKDALFESADYSYYMLSEKPAQYKELTVGADGSLSFSEVKGGEVQTVDGVTASLATSSSYGDYQLNLTGLDLTSEDTVYGVVIHTKEGEDYGLRHLENIWQRTSLAWSAGFVTTSHSSPLSYEHYKSMMGKTITGVTYYTSKGTLEIPLAETYVPVKFMGSLELSNAGTTAGAEGIAVSAKFPADFDAKYTVTKGGNEVFGFVVENGKLTWTETPVPGTYTLTCEDQSGKYAPVSGTFVLETAAVVAQAEVDENGVWKLVAADGVSEAEFDAYLGNIASVKVGDKTYNASGRGSVTIVKGDGTIDLEAKSGNEAIFEVGKTYQIEITATGYTTNLAFEMEVGKIPTPEPQPEGETVTGEAEVVGFGYTGKITVKYDPATGKILSVEDNGTEAGGNASYWNNAFNVLKDKLVGKTKDTVAGVDIVSGATASSNAIKNAVSNALPGTPVDPQEEVQYVLMNIPYEEFYAAEVENNDVDVDAVSSATKNKPRTMGLVGGSYHVNSDGTDISGVIFPVAVEKGTDLSAYRKVTDTDSVSITVSNRGQTTTTEYVGKDALFESADYSYYVLSEKPAQYKELTVGADGSLSFSEVKGGEVQTVDGVTASLATSSSYGDYQLNLTGLDLTSEDTVYGVVIHTKEDEDYALRHLENIWQRTSLAWSAGFVTTSHGSPLSYEHYKSMMGKTITGVTYYTSKGTLEVPLEDMYVPEKFMNALELENASTAAGAEGITVSMDLPADFDAAYKVTKGGNEVSGFTVADGKLTWTGTPVPGTYTLTCEDQNGKYAAVSGTFVLETAAVAAKAEVDENGVWKLVAADGVSEAEFEAYLGNIASVKVGDKTYNASGRGSVRIVKGDGTIDLEAKSGNAAIFEVGKTYQIEITATGYTTNLAFEMEVGKIPTPEPQPEGETVTGEAEVVGFGYTGKIAVKYDPATGKILSVEDNGTEAGGNASYWNNAFNVLKDKLVGKTKDTVAGVDIVSGATASSNAIKNAVSNALPGTPVDPQEEVQYVLMNIPYEEFYAAEVENNDVDVDAVSSATKNKPRTMGLVGGSYHVNSDGTDISGVIFPVAVEKGTDLSAYRKVTDADSVKITVSNRGQTTTTDYVGKDALFESADYSYYVLSEKPAQYKELTVGADGSLSFSEVKGGEVQTVEGVTGSLSTKSNYGDYQLNLTGLDLTSEDTVYGVVIHTKEDEDYALRHLENIWQRTSLAWSAGFVTTSHGSPLSYEHYKSMMGKTITGVTYYTSKGTLEIPLEDMYVPVKVMNALELENADTTAGAEGIAVSAKLPDDFDAVYKVTKGGNEVSGFTVADGKLTWTGTPVPGTYTLTCEDQSGKYASVSGTFVLETAEVAAKAEVDENGVWKLVAADGVSEADFEAYVGNIASVKVGDKTYNASGRGSVTIVKGDGTIDLEAKSGDTAIFEVGKTYQIEITATGYTTNLAFELEVGKIPTPEPQPEEGTATGEAEVVGYGYTGKIAVKYDPATGKILSVEDNGTVPGNSANEGYWSRAFNGLKDKLVGKTKDTVAGVDIVSNATYSSNAIKQAVTSALNSIVKPEEGTNMQKLTFSVDGEEHTVYYSAWETTYPPKTPEFTVKGEDVTDKAVALKADYVTKAYYYIPEGEELTGKIYGTANVPYADFYLGEKITNSGPWTPGDPSLDENMWITTMLNGGYDAVSSATGTTENAGKYGGFSSAYYGELTSSGYEIKGVKTPIEIDAELYMKVRVLSAAGVNGSGQLGPMVASMTGVDEVTENGTTTEVQRELTTEEPAAYKTLFSDGTLSELKGNDAASDVDVSGVKVSLTDQSRYGHYQINVDNLPAEINGRENVLGVVIKTDAYLGNAYGLEHLENIWFNASELAVAVKDGFTSHGNKIDYERYSTMPGQTIKSITYLLSDHKPVVIDNLDLYCPQILEEGQGVTASASAEFKAGEAAEVAITTNLPEDYEAQVESVQFNGKTLDPSEYSYESGAQTRSARANVKGNGVLTLKEGSVKPGSYTVTFRDGAEDNKGYVKVSASFTINSGFAEGDVKLVDNAISLPADSGLTAEDYVSAITSVSVDGTALRRVSGSTIFNADGSVNFDAESRGSKIFKDGADGSYVLKLSAAGYPDVEGTVGQGSVKPEERGLADGIWYGTGEDSFYYEEKGPDVVKITIEGGKVVAAETVVYHEDPPFVKGKDILKAVIGLEDNNVDAIRTQLDNQSGEAYDLISTATRSAESQLWAAENALDRAKKFKQDGIEQPINYMEFVQKPKAQQKGETLDLSGTVLKVHFADGSVKDVALDEMEANGITVTPADGTVMPEEFEKEGLIRFRNDASLVELPASVQKQKNYQFRTPTKVVVSYEDGTTQDVELNTDDFIYRITVNKPITGMSLYDGSEKLADAVQSNTEWNFNLKGVAVGEGYDFWKYETYRIVVTQAADSSPISRFVLTTTAMKREYKVGEALNLDGLHILAITEKGTEKDLTKWSDCQSLGFTSNPEVGYQFTEEDLNTSNGQKTIEISLPYGDQTLTQSYTVKVSEASAEESASPAKIELYDGDTLLQTVEIPEGEFDGYYTVRNVEIPDTYEGNLDQLSVKTYNKFGDVIESGVDTVRKNLIQVGIPGYLIDNEYPGTVTIGFKFVESAVEDRVPTKIEIYDGDTLVQTVDIPEGKVSEEGYAAIAGVEIPARYRDNMDALSAKTYNQAGDLLNSEIGYATNNIVRVLLYDYPIAGEEGEYGTITLGIKLVEEEPEYVEADGEATVGIFGYSAKVTVTYDPASGQVVAIVDNGTEPLQGISPDNQGYWDQAVAEVPDLLIGKTADEINPDDRTDIVSGATFSSQAIKKAVKNALTGKSAKASKKAAVLVEDLADWTEDVVTPTDSNAAMKTDAEEEAANEADEASEEEEKYVVYKPDNGDTDNAALISSDDEDRDAE